MRSAILRLAVCVAASATAACGSLDVLPDLTPGPYESYARSLRQAELGGTRLGASWLTAGEVALHSAAGRQELQALPFQEVLFFDPAEPRAVAYLFELRRGQRLEASVTRPSEAGRCFLDLFEVSADEVVKRVAEAEDGASELRFEVDRPGRFLLRLQPELLVGGPHTLDVVVAGRLAFPVSGASVKDVGSLFGDPRDGGRRRHAGVDIFAPRGTLAVAAAPGLVTRVATNRLGGKVVWMRTGEGFSLYYAHLDDQIARVGSRVRAGDPIGRVGNTGNARNTPPHLHFGLYHGAAIDPLPFLQPRREGVPVAVDLEVFASAGEGWGRIRSAQVNLRRAPGLEGEVLERLSRGTAVELLGAQRDWFRTILPDGTAGYVFASLIEAADRPLRDLRLTRPTRLRTSPRRGGIVVAELAAGSRLAVLGDFAEGLLVRTDGGRQGWIDRPS